jgi:Helix-turn-helix domain
VLKNWIDSGFLPAIRIGRRVRVKRSDFDALLEASYTANKQPSAGVWDGNVPTPAAPGEDAEPEPDEAAEKPAG